MKTKETTENVTKLSIIVDMERGDHTLRVQTIVGEGRGMGRIIKEGDGGRGTFEEWKR